jgi:ubiquinone/menaquinone biosynthesis C-methylase UbiE
MALQRIPEPEVMDSARDAAAYDSMDFTEVNNAFAQRALELAPPAGRVLDIGTGTARIPILMMRQAGSQLRILGVDLAGEMLVVGRKNIALAHLSDRIKLCFADGKDLPFFSGDFDMVVSNSLAHHLPDPRPFFTEVARVLRPDGAVLLRDLLRPESVSDVNKLVHRYAADADEYQRKLYRDSLYASLTLQEVEEHVHAAGLDGVKIYQSSDRHWTVERPCAGVQAG